MTLRYEIRNLKSPTRKKQRPKTAAVLLARSAKEEKMRLQLEGDNLEPIDNPTWDAIDKVVSNLHPKDRCFFSLTDVDTGSFVQLAGARLRLTVEGRVFSEAGFRHFVFGKPERNDKEAYINCKAGPIHVVQSQVLTLDDGKAIFLYFYKNGRLHNEYELQEQAISNK